ncbi:MAG: hypothetical protein JWN89_558 [Parcubacteria group bacterium]|nr:hypothetical protein [Parcubacteria group bacterium]
MEKQTESYSKFYLENTPAAHDPLRQGEMDTLADKARKLNEEVEAEAHRVSLELNNGTDHDEVLHESKLPALEEELAQIEKEIGALKLGH